MSKRGSVSASQPRRAAAAGRTPQKPRGRGLLPLALMGLALVAALILVLALARRGGEVPAGPAPTPAPAAAIGPVDGCRAGPRFQTGLGLSAQAALATSLTNVKGLAIYDPGAPAGGAALYQHPSWDDAGFMGPFITDRSGHIYVAPVPLVSLTDNPPELQNRVYWVDSDTQVMNLFVDLPPAQPPSGANPFGVVGLAYDCETASLYASSLAGSTAGQELGRIFRIDLSTGQAVAQLDGLDVMGLGVFNGAGGKRLYFGLARAAEVRSVALDAQGTRAGEPRAEFSFATHAASGRQTARRLRFTPQGEMQINVMSFNYSLQVTSERREDVLIYRYDPATDAWQFVGREVTG